MIQAAGNPPVIFLLGPTASGKSGLAVALAERLGAEIVSVDSAQVYRGLDIGTAKPDRQTRERVPHALIDIREPWQGYSAAEFRHDARAAIERIRGAGRPVILAGGTSLYFRALEQGLSDLPPRDPAIRAEIRAEAERVGWPALHECLVCLDPVRAERIHPNDKQRIERALEIARVTGQAPSELHRGDRMHGRLEWPVCKIAIAPESRAALHERIDYRLKEMMNKGFLEEVETLAGNPNIVADNAAARAVGYRQLWPVALGVRTVDDGVRWAAIATRQLAKRQLTWLRGQTDAVWFVSGSAGNVDRAVTIVDQFSGE